MATTTEHPRDDAGGVAAGGVPGAGGAGDRARLVGPRAVAGSLATQVRCCTGRRQPTAAARRIRGPRRGREEPTIVSSAWNALRRHPTPSLVCLPPPPPHPDHPHTSSDRTRARRCREHNGARFCKKTGFCFKNFARVLRSLRPSLSPTDLKNVPDGSQQRQTALNFVHAVTRSTFHHKSILMTLVQASTWSSCMSIFTFRILSV